MGRRGRVRRRWRGLFHETVWAHFKGVLKPPFNEEARDRAGFGRAWYMPLTKRPAVAGAGA